MAACGDDEYDRGTVNPLSSFYEPRLVEALQPYLVSKEPPMWVLDSPGPGRGAGAGAGRQGGVGGWIQDFLEFVEAQAARDCAWEPFNTKHALHTPPERCWIDGSSPNHHVTEKLAGFKQFLGHASGCEATFLDEGLQFALKRYPCSKAERGSDPKALIDGEFLAAENLHIDRLQQDPDKRGAAQQALQPSLKGRPTHFTLVVNFDDEAGGTHFPHGRLLPGLARLPPGVTPAAGAEGGERSGILVRGRRGRVLLWSNHRGANASGEVRPLLSSLHQSLIKVSPGGEAGSRRVCIFGWAENGRKWERCGFHECLEYESPRTRADFFGRTVLEELRGWEYGMRAGEVAGHLQSAEAQAEIAAAIEEGLSEEMRAWLSSYGYSDTAKVYQLERKYDDGKFLEFSFCTLAGNREFGFPWEESSITVAQLHDSVKKAYGSQGGQSVAMVEVMDSKRAEKITDKGAVLPAEGDIVVVLRTMPSEPDTQRPSVGPSPDESREPLNPAPGAPRGLLRHALGLPLAWLARATDVVKHAVLVPQWCRRRAQGGP